MFRRLATFAVVAGCLPLLTGCIDMTQTITLNPDGKGKVVYEMAVTPLLAGGGMLKMGGPNAKEKTPEEMLQDFAKTMLEKKGVTAWKDVSYKWTSEGKIHFAGTAYFENIDDVEGIGGGNAGGGPGPGAGPGGPSFGQFTITKDKNLWKIAAKKEANPLAGGGLNPPPNPNQPKFDPTKATPKEWDEMVLKMRIGYQSMRPFLMMMFTDLKIKTVYRLPGEVTEARGFTKQGAGVVTHTMDGEKLMDGFKKFMTQDAAAWKRVMQQMNNKPVNPQDLVEKMGLPAEMMAPSMTLRVEGKEQFDYAKEVQAARQAYPRLREQLKLDAGIKLPGEQ